jgi:hypothetical protein
MRVFCGLLLAGATFVGHATTLCEVVNQIDSYNGKSVRIRVQAEAALHEFDVALTDPNCPNKNIFLSAGREFENDAVFMWVMRQLYPGYPHDDAYSHAKPELIVEGKVFQQTNRGLRMTYLELSKLQRP